MVLVYGRFLLDVHDVFTTTFCCFSTTNQRFLKLHFVSHFSGSCMTFSTSLMFLGFVEENDFFGEEVEFKQVEFNMWKWTNIR